MITYEYQCSNCTHNFEIQQSIKDKPLTECPKCSTISLERVIHTPMFFDKTPKTLGTRAEKNAQKLGSEALSEKRELMQKQKDEQRELARQEIEIKTGIRVGRKKKEKAWYGEIDKKDLKKIQQDKTGKSVEKYIMEGKV